jgi:hypothetical protein
MRATTTQALAGAVLAYASSAAAFAPTPALSRVARAAAPARGGVAATKMDMVRAPDVSPFHVHTNARLAPEVSIYDDPDERSVCCRNSAQGVVNTLAGFPV